MKLSAVLARRVVPPSFRVTIGGTIGFETGVDAPVELRIDGHLVARGEVGVRDGRYAVRVLDHVAPMHPKPEAGTLEVVLAERDVETPALAAGDVVEFEQRQMDAVALTRDGRLVARGYITPLADRVGVKIVELVVT